MAGRLQDKIAIVTGAGQGIGKAIALRLAQEGAHVVVAEYNPQTAAAVAAEIADCGRRSLAYPVDIGDMAATRSMIEKTVETFERLDILVNNAGVNTVAPFMKMPEADWDRVMKVNLRGTYFCLEAGAEQLVRQVPDQVKAAGKAEGCYGKIVTITSISGQGGRPLAPHYAASKAALINITQSAAQALAPYGINVNSVCPGVVATPMWDKLDEDYGRLSGAGPGQSWAAFVARIPLKRASSPEAIAAAVAFLCSPDADDITGHTLNVDGGLEMH
jgi:meso-butanediol dehydrogenase / (S,S)-butanediol dehydrogenase / diacetyl reductase